MEKSIQHYVLGFAFSADRSKIVMIRKNRPAWQAGKLNCLGGKIEGQEDPLHAMCREFAEETGVATEPAEWQFFAALKLLQGDVHCYRLFSDKVLDAQTIEDEEIVIIDVDLNRIRQDALTNCVWLIGIALDDNTLLTGVTATYNQDLNNGYQKATQP